MEINVKNLKSVTINSNDVQKIILNGTTIWEKVAAPAWYTVWEGSKSFDSYTAVTTTHSFEIPNVTNFGDYDKVRVTVFPWSSNYPDLREVAPGETIEVYSNDVKQSITIPTEGNIITVVSRKKNIFDQQSHTITISKVEVYY